MNFIASVPGKLHCTLERMTNCAGKSQITGPGGKFVITQGYDHGQLGRTHSRILRKRHHKFLECFLLFLTRTLSLQDFL